MTNALKRYEHLETIKLPFRNKQNQRYSKQLFYETWVTLPDQERLFLPVFTLNAKVPGLVNFGSRYIQDRDISGYTTSTSLLGEFGYWQHLMKAGWFREAKEDWDKEIEAALFAEGLRKIRELAEGTDAKALQAAKFLVNKDYAPKRSTHQRGRPNKDEVEGAVKEAAREASEIADDLARIRVVK